MSNNKWIPLDGKKEPPFGETLALWCVPEKGDEFWIPGILDEIKTKDSGKERQFLSQGEVVVLKVTHYMIPSSPNEVKTPKKEKTPNSKS